MSPNEFIEEIDDKEDIIDKLQYFELIEEYRECFDEEIFSARYSDILDKYDYVVVDYGYDQLRLKGFYKDSNKRQK